MWQTPPGCERVTESSQNINVFLIIGSIIHYKYYLNSLSQLAIKVKTSLPKKVLSLKLEFLSIYVLKLKRIKVLCQKNVKINNLSTVNLIYVEINFFLILFDLTI